MVHLEKRDKVAILTLDRPEVRNAIERTDAELIEAFIDDVENDDSIWVSIITGTGSVFCSGANIKAFANGGGPPRTDRGGFAGIVTRYRHKPLIAAVNGPALAGGCEIALACDLVVASTTASFGLTEVKRSLVAAGGGLHLLPRAVAKNIAMEMALTGDPIDAARAHQAGLANEVVEPADLMNAALSLAERICANAPLAVRESRDVLINGLRLDAEHTMAIAEESMDRIRKTDDFTEGSRAFFEKRPPEWHAR